jgi:hypothetical protein
MQRFPAFELSYETHPHKKVSPEYNVCIAIPVGKKCFAWFTFSGDKNVCYFIELNREKKAGKITVSSMSVPTNLAKGTLLYGTLLDPIMNNTEVPIFLADDIFYFCGIPTRNLLFSDKLGFIDAFFTKFRIENAQSVTRQTQDVHLALPVMWPIYQQNDYECLYETGKIEPKYAVHHLQYRCLNMAGPFYNVMPTRKFTGSTSFGSSSVINKVPAVGQFKEKCAYILPVMNPNVRMDIHKPQYRNFTIFVVMADLQFDVYHLYAYGRNKEFVYCGVAYIANYKVSVFMNGIFRKIKENTNLDAIEESDDEEDFQDINCDKYVDLERQVQMECKWNMRFKKWEPVRKLEGSHKVVHISQLASNY